MNLILAQKSEPYFNTWLYMYLQDYYHEQAVQSIDVQNSTLASGSYDSKVQARNMETNVKLFEVAHNGPVYCVKLVGNRLVSCGDTTIRIWSLADGSSLHTLYLPGLCINFDLNSEGTLLAVAHYQGVSIYNFSSLDKIAEKKPATPNSYVSDVRFNEPGTKLIIGQYNGQVSKIDLN